MNHHKKLRKFNRVRSARKALINGLALSLVMKEKIKTTEPKAESLRPFVEKIVTKGKKATVASRREIIASLGKVGAKKVVDTLSPKYKDRKGGYTRITKLPPRVSDGSKMAVIEFV